jgi:hypothetical protein
MLQWTHLTDFHQLKVAEAFSLRGTKPDVQTAAVRWLLELLNTENGDKLRSLFATDFTALMTKLIRDKRKDMMEIFKATIEDDFTTAGFDQYHILHLDLLQTPWLWPLLEESLPKFLECWPRTEDLRTLHSIYLALDSAPDDTQTCLRDLIESYILENAGTINQRPREFITSLIHFWQSCQDWTRRRIALLLVGRAGYSSSAPYSWLEQLPSLSESFLQTFKFIFIDYEEHPNRACISMADLLATASLSVDMSHWRPVLHRMIADQGDELLEYALEELKLQEWVIFLQNIHCLYGNFPNWQPSRCPAVLKPGLLDWNKKLLPYVTIIDSLREKPNSSDAIRCICYSAVYGIKPKIVRGAVQQIIEILKPRQAPNANEDDSAVRVSILSRLTRYKTSAPEVHKSLLCLNDLSPTGLEICIRVQHLLDTNPSPYVARTFLEAWLSEPTLNRHDMRILKDFFKFESTPKESSASWLEDKGLALAADYLDSEYAELLDEARRLAAIRACLKTIDLQGVTELLESIEIEDSPAVEDVLSSLSPEIVNAVEIVGEKEVEILFSLTDLTLLQRTALGLGTTQSFVLLLELCDHKTKSGRFCIHLGAESKYKYGLVDTNLGGLLRDIDNLASPWNYSCRLGGTSSPPCCSLEASPFKRNFTIMLQRHLQASNLGRDFTSLSELHSFISDFLKNIGRYCTECGQEFSTNLRKPTICNSSTCTSSFLTTNPAIRLSDIIRDPIAADLLISSVYYAAFSKNIALIPSSPIADTTKILTLLNQLPSTLTLSKQLSQHSSYNIEANAQSLQLLTYIITHPRSYLLTATGNLKIPSLPPGTLQFVLASTPPERETLFSSFLLPPKATSTSSLHNPIHLHPSKIIPFYDSDSDSEDDDNFPGGVRETRILFHGTNPDRLWPILCQGLRNLSNTPLQCHGAVSGQGVYLADEPSTSFRYCSDTFSPSLPNKNKENHNWKNSEIFGSLSTGAGGKGKENVGKEYKILLGVEHAGKRVTSGEDVFHVVREEASLVVRYLFLIPDDAGKVPVGRHLVPAMGSVCKGIRGGVL